MTQQMGAVERWNPNKMPMAASVEQWDDLCIWLGGSNDSWTGVALHLIQKSDVAHRAALRKAVPLHVAAFEVWSAYAGYGLTVEDLETELLSRGWAPPGRNE